MRREALITASTCHFTIYFAYCYFKNLRGRPFDFCREVWAISEKNISWRLISREKDPARKYLGRKNSCSENNIQLQVCQVYVGEKSNARGLENFFFYPNQITHNPLKSQMVGSLSFHAQEKRSTCFSMTTTVFLKIKKLVVQGKR